MLWFHAVLFFLSLRYASVNTNATDCLYSLPKWIVEYDVKSVLQNNAMHTASRVVIR